MGDKTYIWLTVGISLLVLTSPAGAQDEQWLQYHSEREAQQIVGDLGSSHLEFPSEKPQGLELPQFKGQEQLFTKWPSPMVKSGYLWIALDCARKQGQWDRLFIDSNGNGHLNDETPVTAYRTDQSSAYFGPVKVVFEGEDEPLTYHLNIRLYNVNVRSRGLHVYSGGWYEGNITVAGVTKHCTLIDYNANGTFNDKSIHPEQCDRIQIGKKESQNTRFVGNYIEVDGVLYQPEIARDGAYIKLTKAEDVKFGNIRVPETITEFSAGGENGLFTLKPTKGIGSLPAGKYRINSWTIERKDEKGKQWKLEGRSFSVRGDFEVTEKTATSLDVGEPVIGHVRARKIAGNYEFDKELRGRLGEYVRLTSSGRSVGDMYRMQAKNKEGTFEKMYPIPDQ